MTTRTYRYRFARTVSARDIEETLALALMAVESLHGRARLRMDGHFRFDQERHICEIDASTRVGTDLAEIFTGYATREYGDDAVAIQQETDEPGNASGRCSGAPCAPTGVTP